MGAAPSSTASRRSVQAFIAELPGAIMVGATVVTAVVLAAGPVADGLILRTGVSAMLIALFAGTTGAVAWRLSSRSSASAGGFGLIPVGWLVLLGAVFLWRRGTDSLEWFLGGDNMQHLGMVSVIVRTGELDYSESPYPRAWHTLVALAWTVGDKGLGEADVTSLIALDASATWLLFAFLVAATSILAVTAADRIRPGDRGVGSLAALLAGCWLMTPRFMADIMALGFQTTLLAALIVAVAARECLLRGRRTLDRYLVLVSSVVLMAHTWQLLVPAVALPTAVMGWHVVTSDRRTQVVALLVTLVAAPTAYVPFAAVFNGPGAGATAMEGVVAAPVWPVLFASVVAAVVVSQRLGMLERISMLSVVLVPALMALTLVALLGGSLTYYPIKLLWHTTALGVGLVAAAVAVTVVAVARSTARSTRTSRAGAVALGVGASLLALWGLVTPLGSQMHAWSTVDGRRVIAAAEMPGASGAQGVWMATPTESAVTRTLLASLRGAFLNDDSLTPADECRDLRTASVPTVVTSHPAEAARERYDCVDRLVVITAAP